MMDDLGATLPGELATIEGLQAAFRRRDYVADRSLSTAVFLALRLGRPLLLEGEAGVGKTQLAKTLADTLGARLIRLQCYEGLDVNDRGLRVELRPPDAGDPAPARRAGRSAARRPTTSSGPSSS